MLKHARIVKLIFIICSIFLFCTSVFADSARIQNPENGNWYQRIDTSMSWHDARAYCEDIGGYLATITSEEEHNFVYDNIISASSNNCWLGAMDEENEGVWKWVTGEPWVYTRWKSGEPNNCGGAENYLHYFVSSSSPSYWNDIGSGNNGGCGCSNCSEIFTMSALCEWDIDLKEGLVAYYPFNGNADDESGNGNHGTVYGAALTEDRFGNVDSAYSFDGVDDYINIASNTIFDVQNITVTAWISLASSFSNTQRRIINRQWPQASCWGLQVFGDNYYGAETQFDFHIGNGSTWVSCVSITDLETDHWYFVAATHDSITNIMRVYVNGELENQCESHGLISPIFKDIYIGKQTHSPDFNWDGLIDDIRIYSRALSESEIYAVYCEGQPLSVYYLDADGDGFGDPDVTIESCVLPPGYADNPDDCDDTDPNTNPDALEICDGKDNNCNGIDDEDEGCYCTNYYRDLDQDGFGVTGDSLCLYAPDTDGIYTAPIAGDLDDTDPAIYPRTFRIIDTQVYPGDTNVVVQIEIMDAKGTAGADIIMNFDPNILFITEVRTTSLINGFSTQTYIDQINGRVTLVMASPTGMTDDRGILAELIFDFVDTVLVGGSTPVSFEEVLVYNENVDFCGAFLTDGMVYLCTPGDLNRDKRINSADAIIILQAAVGIRDLDDYQLCAGDVNKDGLINSADAILVLKAATPTHTIFFITPDSGQEGKQAKIIGWNFGDAQGDSVVSFDGVYADPDLWSDHLIMITVPSDINSGLVDVYIEDLSNTSNTSNVCKFMVNADGFERRSMAYRAASYETSHYDDISRYKTFSYDDTSRYKTSMYKIAPLENGHALRSVSLPAQITAGPCEQISIPININDATDIGGMDIVVTFDPSLLEPADFKHIELLTDLTKGFLVSMGLPNEGEIWISMANSSGIEGGDGALLKLIFDVSPDAQEGDSAELIIKRLSLYDYNAYRISGEISANGLFIVQGRGHCGPVPKPKPVTPYAYLHYYPFNMLWSYYTYNNEQSIMNSNYLLPYYYLMDYYYPLNDYLLIHEYLPFYSLYNSFYSYWEHNKAYSAALGSFPLNGGFLDYRTMFFLDYPLANMGLNRF